MLYQQNYRFKVVRLGNSKGLGSSKLQWSFETSRFEMKKRDFNWVLPTSIHTRRFGLIVLFRPFSSSFYDSYTPGHLLDLRSHLVACTGHLLLLS